jgi:hypothetical protein
VICTPPKKKLKPILSAAKDPLDRSSLLGILRFILEPSLEREQNGRLQIGKEHRYFSLRMGFGFLFMESTRKKIETNPERSEGSPRPEFSLGDSSLYFGAFIRKGAKRQVADRQSASLFSLRMFFGFLFMESTRKKIETNPERSEGSPRPEFYVKPS